MSGREWTVESSRVMVWRHGTQKEGEFGAGGGDYRRPGLQGFKLDGAQLLTKWGWLPELAAVDLGF